MSHPERWNHRLGVDTGPDTCPDDNIRSTENQKGGQEAKELAATSVAQSLWITTGELHSYCTVRVTNPAEGLIPEGKDGVESPLTERSDEEGLKDELATMGEHMTSTDEASHVLLSIPVQPSHQDTPMGIDSNLAQSLARGR